VAASAWAGPMYVLYVSGMYLGMLCSGEGGDAVTERGGANDSGAVMSTLSKQKQPRHVLVLYVYMQRHVSEFSAGRW